MSQENTTSSSAKRLLNVTNVRWLLVTVAGLEAGKDAA